MFARLGLEFVSAALSPLEGCPASQGSVEYVEERGLSLDNHVSRAVDPVELKTTAWVIGMTRSHAAIFKSRFGKVYSGRIGVLGAPGLDLARETHCPDLEEVDDPYGMSRDRYFETGRQIERLLETWKPEFTRLSEMESKMLVAIGSDHRGFLHKEKIKDHLKAEGIEVIDFGCHSEESADYTDAALPAAEMVGTGQAEAGVLICGSGIGMSIAANKVKGVRASLCFTEDQARTTRQHNDSNLLCLSGDGVSPELAVDLFKAWISSEFEGGRHARRVNKFIEWENNHMKQE